MSSLRHFLETFVCPLVEGGTVTIDAPIPAKTVDRWSTQLAETADPRRRIERARQDALLELLPCPPECAFDLDDLSLSAAMHNLLFLAHPALDRGWIGDARENIVRAAIQLCELGPIDQWSVLYGRHALLNNLFSLQREDTLVEWWTGRARFIGQIPPQRLTRWGTLRRVQATQRMAPIDELVGHSSSQRVLATLLKNSPLTPLLAEGSAVPPLVWEEHTFLLRHRPTARAIVHFAIHPRGGDAWWRIPARYALGFLQMLDRRPAFSDVTAVLLLLVHLHHVLALGPSPSGDDATSDDPQGSRADGDAPSSDPRAGLAAFWAAPFVLAALQCTLDIAPADLEPVPAHRWRSHLARAQRHARPPRIDNLVDRIQALLPASAPEAFPPAHSG